MGIEKGGGFAQNAFLGEKARSVELVKKIDEVAEKTNGILNPIDDVAKRKVVEDSIKLIRGLGIQVDSVTALNETLDDRNKIPKQKENAERVLDTLAKGVYVAMRYGKNAEIRADLCSGSVERINDRLPEPLKGLGGRVRANIIDEPKIIEVLDGLDKKRVRFEKAGEIGKQQLREAVGNSIGKLGELDVDSAKEDQLEMVMAFLGVEGEKISLVNEVTDAERKYKGRIQRVIRPIGQEAGEVGPGGSDEYEAGLYELEFSDFLETAMFREQVPWRIENRPQWYKDPFSGAKDKEVEILERQIFYDATRKLTDGSSWLQFYQNSDLEKCWHNPSFTYSGKELNALMNKDFKKISKWMLNDLCTFEITPDGVERLVYKSGKNGIGIDDDVKNNISNMMDYEKKLALKLAEERGETKASEMDILIACNAWNMFFMTYGSSLADVDRVLAPNSGKVSDKIRTLNSEAKSRKKLQIFNMGKGVEMTGDNGSLLEAEWFGGGVSAWVEMVLTIEDATGKAMDGKKTLRQKIIDKDMWFFDSPLLYSFYDTKEVSVDMLDNMGKPVFKEDEKTKKVILDKNGNPEIKKDIMTVGRALYEGKDFSFENNEDDTMSDFRDITEAAVRTWNVLVGKSQIKSNNLTELTNELRSSVGLLDQIKLKGKLPGRISRVVSTPEFWGMCLVNTFGPNMDVLASDGIYIKGAISASSYPEFLERVYNKLQLNDFVNPKLYRKFLKGDGGTFGQTRDRIRGSIKNQSIEQVFKKKWRGVETYYENNRVNAESFADKEKAQVAKWYNSSLQNGDMVAAERFKKILDGIK
jgi:hypothetical protein